jgi:hypothetical protein
MKVMIVNDWKELALNGKAWKDLVDKAISQKDVKP